MIYYLSMGGGRKT